MILTYKYRIKDRSTKNALRRHAVGVNQVWNYLNGYQRDIEARYKAGAPSRRWPGHFALTYMVSGAAKELGINSSSVGETCRIFAQSRAANRRSLRLRLPAATSPTQTTRFVRPAKGSDMCKPMTHPTARPSGETKLTLTDFSDVIDCRLKWIARHGHDPMDMYDCKSCGASLSVKARSAKPPCQVVIARAQPEKRDDRFNGSSGIERA